jgi:hypothetical protein
VSAIRNYGWLLVGAGVGLLIAWLGVGESMSAGLSAMIPLPWGAIGIASVVFIAFTSLHFRLQLVRLLEQQQLERERGAAASQLIQSAVSDGRRWLRVVQENLELVSSESQGRREKHLYLEGAGSNSNKIEQAFDRIEGHQRRLDGPDSSENR